MIKAAAPVTTLDSPIHESEKVGAGVLAGKLQPATEGRFGGQFQQCRVLSGFGAGIAAKREGINDPKLGSDRIRVEALGHLRRHLGEVGTEGAERRLRIANATLGTQIVGDDGGLAQLDAAGLP